MPAINESFKAITAHYSSEELITKRDEVSHAIHDELQAKVLPYGLTISSISFDAVCCGALVIWMVVGGINAENAPIEYGSGFLVELPFL